MPPIIQTDFIKLFCGKCIGNGCYRQVYEHKFDDSLVIKIECADNKVFCNIREWTIWSELPENEMKRYFAPCIDISENGLILIQKRTKPIS